MFACRECGRKFRTVKAARAASFGDRGCPGCGGSDIDIDPNPAPARTAPEKHRRAIEKADAKMPDAIRDVMSGG